MLREKLMASGVTNFVTSYEELVDGNVYLKYYVSNKDNMLKSIFCLCCCDLQGKIVLIPIAIGNWAERDIARKWCIERGFVFAYIPKEVKNNG